jgi:predicted DNA-binding transcriptional regulator AlpA
MVTTCAAENAIVANQRGMLFDSRISHELPRYLSCLELAEILNVSVHTIRSWRKLRIITPKKFGRSVRWLLHEVMEELAKRKSFR